MPGRRRGRRSDRDPLLHGESLELNPVPDHALDLDHGEAQPLEQRPADPARFRPQQERAVPDGVRLQPPVDRRGDTAPGERARLLKQRNAIHRIELTEPGELVVHLGHQSHSAGQPQSKRVEILRINGPRRNLLGRVSLRPESEHRLTIKRRQRPFLHSPVFANMHRGSRVMKRRSGITRAGGDP